MSEYEEDQNDLYPVYLYAKNLRTDGTLERSDVYVHSMFVDQQG